MGHQKTADTPPPSRGTFRTRGLLTSTLLKNRGRREGRVAAAPGAPAQKKLARAREPQVQAVSTDLPCAAVYGLYRALPGEPAFATVVGTKPLELRANLAPAWARQDHTTSPSASVPLVYRHRPVHRI